MNIVENMIKDMIANNKENIEFLFDDEYGQGYCEGYHDALVDLMNGLYIEHNEEIYNQ